MSVVHASSVGSRQCISRGCCQYLCQSLMPPVLVAVSVCISCGCCQCGQSVFLSFRPGRVGSHYQMLVLPVWAVRCCVCRPCHQCISRRCCQVGSLYLCLSSMPPKLVAAGTFISLWCCQCGQSVFVSSMPPVQSVLVSVEVAARVGSQFMCLSSIPPVLVAVSICISRGCCQCGQSVFVSVIHAASFCRRQYLYQSRALPVWAVIICVCRPSHQCW